MKLLKQFFSILAILAGLVVSALIILGGFIKDLLGKIFQSRETAEAEQNLSKRLAMEALLATVLGNAIAKGASGVQVREVEEYLSCPLGRFSSEEALEYAARQGWAEVVDGSLRISELGRKFASDFAISVR